MVPGLSTRTVLLALVLELCAVALNTRHLVRNSFLVFFDCFRYVKLFRQAFHQFYVCLTSLLIIHLLNSCIPAPATTFLQ